LELADKQGNKIVKA
jgi:hypothetical protein